MHQTIQQKLHDIESSQPLSFLLAVESGSRAWGFPSPDSDYDVRTIFIRPKTDYLSLQPAKETFEYIENEWFDVGGWDLRKALNLLAKSNSVLLEWFQSPIIYQQDSQFMTEIRPLLPNYFQIAPTVHHYRGIAKNALSQLDFSQKVRLKKWLYVLRPLLAALWAAKEQCIPPMEFVQLCQLLPASLTEEIADLVALKATQNESYLHSLSPRLVALTHQLWQDVENLQIKAENRPLDLELLNQLFRKMLDKKE